MASAKCSPLGALAMIPPAARARGNPRDANQRLPDLSRFPWPPVGAAKKAGPRSNYEAHVSVHKEILIG